ncbi:MAG: creatininase family protein [Sandaracinaceae bacterium]
MTRRPCMLAELSFEDARAVLARGAVALLPTGATEAHGPHLPLATDVVIATEGARRAARQLEAEGLPALVLPPVAYAVTEFAADFSGTISLPIDTARALLRDVILGAVRTGFRAVVVCNAHLEPGNLQAIREAVDEATARGARAAFPDVTRKPHALRLGDEFKSGACHAGRYETSLVLAANPFLVKTELAATLPDNPASLSQAIREGKRSFVEAGGAEAYFGYPREATALEGEKLYGELADIFAGAARALAKP